MRVESEPTGVGVAYLVRRGGVKVLTMEEFLAMDPRDSRGAEVCFGLARAVRVAKRQRDVERKWLRERTG